MILIVYSFWKKCKLKKDFINIGDFLLKEKFFLKVSKIYIEEGVLGLENFLDKSFSYADSKSFKFYGENMTGVISYNEIEKDKNNK